MSRDHGFVALGRIALCGFALLFVVSLAVADEALSLSGGGLDGWMSAGGGAPSAGWAAEDGAIVRKDKGGYIWTRQRFGDFVLELDYKTEGNSGIFIRTDDPKNCVQTGIEVAIDRPSNDPHKHSPGALYDLVAPTKEASKANEFNHVVITAKGSQITVEINGEKVVDANLDEWTEGNKNPDGTKNKFSTALKDFKRDGHIGLQDHGATVMFRNIKIKKL
jgi:hypothetical protein